MQIIEHVCAKTPRLATFLSHQRGKDKNHTVLKMRKRWVAAARDRAIIQQYSFHTNVACARRHICQTMHHMYACAMPCVVDEKTRQHHDSTSFYRFTRHIIKVFLLPERRNKLNPIIPQPPTPTPICTPGVETPAPQENPYYAPIPLPSSRFPPIPTHAPPLTYPRNPSPNPHPHPNTHPRMYEPSTHPDSHPNTHPRICKTHNSPPRGGT